MNINATLIGQMITFILFVWFTMKFVWPPIMRAMRERQKQIADGLAAAEKGKRDLELARHKSGEIIQEAKIDAARIIEQANKRKMRIVEEAKDAARIEGERLITGAKSEIETQFIQAKDELQKQVAGLAVVTAEKMIKEVIDPSTQKKLIDGFTTQLNR